VAWVANGCVRYAGGGRSTAADPCPAAEVTLYAIANAKLRGDHTRVPVRCVAARTGTCRGTVFGKLGRRVVARGGFAVPAGRQRWVRLRVNPATVRRFRREGDGSLIIGANVRDGRVGSGCCGDSELTVYAR
jgi:hypothetical protein